MYWFASLMGQPGASSALTTRLLRDVSVDADATRSLLRVLNHDLRPSELFTPPMLASATSRSNVLDQPSLVIVGRLAVDVVPDVTLLMLREIHQSVSLLRTAVPPLDR